MYKIIIIFFLLSVLGLIHKHLLKGALSFLFIQFPVVLINNKLSNNISKRLLFVFGFVFFAFTVSYSATRTSQATGNWNVPGTWLEGVVPVNGDDVTILTGNTVTVTTTAACTNVTINAGGTLTVNDDQTFSVSGNFTNNGTFTENRNTIVFNGTGVQTISGSSAITFGNLTINNTNTTDIVQFTGTSTFQLKAMSAVSVLTLSKGVFKIGTGKTLFLNGNGNGNTINNPNVTGTSNIATTGSNGSDGGTITFTNGNPFTVNGPGLTTFFNINANSNPSFTISSANTVLINGTINIGHSGSGTNGLHFAGSNSPIYGPSSTLNINFNTIGYTPGPEWLAMASGTIGTTPGYPNNVLITNIGTSAGYVLGHNYGWVPTGNLSINGVLTIGDGAATNGQVCFNSISGNFSCGGVVLNTGSFFCPPGSGDIIIYSKAANSSTTNNGNWYRNSGATFVSNSSHTVNFAGGTGATCTTPQLISVSSGTETQIDNLTISGGTYAKLGSPVTLPVAANGGILTLTSGILQTDAVNILTVTNTNTSAITGGSSNTYIDGPVKWYLQSSSVTYNFPMGAGGCTTTYLPFILNSKNTTVGNVAAVQAYNVGSGGSPDGTTITSISTTEYWSFSTTSGLGTTGSTVSIYRPTSVAACAVIAECSTGAGGSYSSYGGTVGTYVPDFGIGGSNNIGTVSPWFFVFGYNSTSTNIYNVTGGGSYCSGGAGVAVGLSNSQTSINYQLYRNGGAIAVGSPVAGTGSAISFGNQTIADTYTIVAFSGSCPNNMNGSAVITVNALPTVTAGGGAICTGSSQNITAGGASTYSWSNGLGTGSTKTVSPTTSTTYTVTGTDLNSCTNTANAVVTVNSLPTVTATSGTICIGSSYTITASGASTYTWNGGGTGATKPVSPTTTSTYTVTGTDSHSCTNTANAVVTVNSLPTVTAGGGTICNGGSTNITAGGASSYSWSNGLGTGTPKTVSPTISITYTVTGTDLNICTNTANAVVIVNPLPTVTTAVGGAICSGGSTSITASGASTYSWSNGLGTGTPKTVSPTTSFTYTVTGTDVNSCTNTANAVVTVNSLPTVTATSGAVCIGSSYTITASGASTYTWSGGGTGATKAVSPIAVSTYTVTGTDSHSCTNSATAIVTVNSLPTVTAGGGTICSGSSINITAGGASTYSWSNSLGTGTPKSVSPTTSTTYTVTGTDVSSCTNTANAVVIINPLPTVTTAVGGAICSGGSTNITASGASTYSWSNGLGSSNPVTVSPAITTTYTVTGTDGNACTNTANAVVTVGGALPIITFTTNPSSGSICVGDIASITASGADIYVWSNGLGSSNPLTVNPTTNTTYTVTGTNTFGCSNTATTVITVNSFPSIIITYNPSSGIICKSQKLAAIYANPTDGISSYNYSWNTGGSSSSLTGLTPTSSTTYTVTVTNTDGSCPITANAVITVNTAVPSVTVSQLTSFVCNGNMTTLTANPTGGSGVYSYSWSAALGSTQTVNASPTTTTTYTVTVTDANTCTTKNTATFKVLTVASATSAATICNGGSATLSATESGGTSPYTYSWSSNPLGYTSTYSTAATTVTNYAVYPTITSTYTVTTTDANSCSATSSVAVKVVTVTSTANTVVCNGSSFTLSAASGNSTALTYSWSSNPIAFSSTLSTQSVTPASATTYTVTYTSTSGCTATSSTSVSINSIPVITVNPATNVCKGSTVSLSSTSGDSYAWASNPAGLSSASSTPTVAPTATTTYTVSVTTSGKSCSATNKVTISAWTQTNSLTVSPNPVCNGVTVALAVTPVAGSTYVWSSGCVGTASCNVIPAVTTTYTVTITKTLTGTCIAGTIVTVNPLPTVTAGGGGLICNGNSSNITASGASTYNWNSNPSGFSSTSSSPTVSPTISTTYLVTGSDGNGCSATNSASVLVDSPTMTTTGTCSGGSSATLSASGMNTYSWSNSLGTGPSVIVSPTVTTVYTVTGTDASLCTLTSTITVLMSPSCSILPVTLLYFRNECANNVNELQWATATETNNDYFTIQYSKDGYYFEDIKKILGAGNSNRIIEYKTNVSTEDNEIYPVYYRLKQTDYNGTYSYSDIIAFNGCLKDFSFRIINNGNTFNRDLFIKIISNDTYPLNISLYDFTGRLVENKVHIIDKNIHIVIPNLSSGIYILKITNTFKNYMEKIMVR